MKLDNTMLRQLTTTSSMRLTVLTVAVIAFVKHCTVVCTKSWRVAMTPAHRPGILAKGVIIGVGI